MPSNNKKKIAGKDDFTADQIQLLGNRIKQLRREAGFTNAEQFAFMNNIARSQWARYEVGSDLKYSSLLKIISALNVTLSHFFSEGFD